MTYVDRTRIDYLNNIIPHVYDGERKKEEKKIKENKRKMPPIFFGFRLLPTFKIHPHLESKFHLHGPANLTLLHIL
jgi:hypothetical protein